MHCSKLEELERGAAAPTFREAAADLQRLPVTEVLALVGAAYEQAQLDVSSGGDPWDPTMEHRSAVTYRAWFQSTAGAVLAQARSRTSTRGSEASDSFAFPTFPSGHFPPPFLFLLFSLLIRGAP